MTPFCHLKPRHRKPVPVAAGKNAEQLQSSLFGSGSSVCEMPVMRPRTFLTGQRTTLFRSLLPSVPRTVTIPFRHSVACRTWLPTKVGTACHPAAIVDAEADAGCPAEGSGSWAKS